MRLNDVFNSFECFELKEFKTSLIPSGIKELKTSEGVRKSKGVRKIFNYEVVKEFVLAKN